jgi:hypothetical protein
MPLVGIAVEHRIGKSMTRPDVGDKCRKQQQNRAEHKGGAAAAGCNSGNAIRSRGCEMRPSGVPQHHEAGRSGCQQQGEGRKKAALGRHQEEYGDLSDGQGPKWRPQSISRASVGFPPVRPVRFALVTMLARRGGSFKLRLGML